MKLKTAAIFALVLAASACGTDAPDSAEQLDLVVTFQQPDFPFTQIGTYAMPNQIVEITDPAPAASPAPTPAPSPSVVPTTVDPALAQPILDEINKQMTSRGYTLVPGDGSVKPDIFLEVSKMTTVDADVYYSYWGSYWGSYYAPYYGTGYGVGYAPYAVPYVSTSTFGSLIINATNPNNPDPATQQIPIAWAAVLNGLVDGATTPELQQRAISGVQQAFEQSPYFTRNTQ